MILKNIRQKKLLELIKDKQDITVKDIKTHLNAAHATIQRDLKYFQDNGVIIRTYGGVSYNDDAGRYQTSLIDYEDYDKRTIDNYGEKQRIGKAAQVFVEPGDSIFITHGTTTSQMAHYLEENKLVNIFTTGLDIIMQFEGKTNIRVFSLGGVINYNSKCIEQSEYIATEVRNANINKLVMGIGGISLSHGITFYDAMSYSLIGSIIPQVKDIIVLADKSKIDKVCLTNYILLSKITKFITNDELPDEYKKRFDELNIQYVIA